MKLSKDNQFRVSQFRQKGYFEMPALLSPSEADYLLSLIQSAKGSLAKSSLNRSMMRFYSNVFKTDVRIQEIIASQKVIDAIAPVAGPDLWIRWDQAVMKRPGGEEFPWHQDNGYNRLRVEHYQLWFALTDMKEDNGGLWLLPGSHLHGIKSHRNVAHHQITDADEAGAIKIEAAKGDAVLFSSLLLHKTSPNITDRNRWAYVVEYMSQEHFDPFVDPPFFLVSQNGISKPHWAASYPGSRSLANKFKYMDLFLKENMKTTKEGLKGWIRKIIKN